MSWSVAIMGSPKNVAAQLDAESLRMDGESKREFESALPHLKALVLENFARDTATGSDSPVVRVTAAGHGHAVAGTDVYRNLGVTISHEYIKVV